MRDIEQIEGSWLCRFGLHAWGIWQDKNIEVQKPVHIKNGVFYKGPSIIKFSELWQERRCFVCNKLQMRYIK